MNRTTRWATLASGIALTMFVTAAEAHHTSHARPAGPVLQLTSAPRVVLTGDAMVYVADDPALRFDGDLFRYGQYWYAHRAKHWYRALGYQGSFKSIDKARVPRAVLIVPKRFWKSTEGQAAKASVKPRTDSPESKGALAADVTKRAANRVR